MSHQSSALAATVRGGATAHPPRVRHALYGPTPGCGTATPDGRYFWICPSSVFPKLPTRIRTMWLSAALKGRKDRRDLSGEALNV